MNRKLYLFSFLIIGLGACTKTHVSGDRPRPPITSAFGLNDSLKISSFFDSLVPGLYDRYNGKYYTVYSTDKVGFNVKKAGTNILFEFSDYSVPQLVPFFRITIVNGDFTNLPPQYDMTDTAVIKLYDDQAFADGSHAFTVSERIKDGVFKISYNKDLKTVSGEIKDLKFPVSFWVPEIIDPLQGSINGLYLLESGSYRVVNLQFNTVPVY